MSGTIARRIGKLQDAVVQLTTRQVAAVLLDLAECPSWAEPLPDGRCVLLGLGDKGARDAVLKALEAGEEPPKTAHVLEYRRIVSDFIADAVDGNENSELLAASPRGEGKSQGALGAILAHALVHVARGFALPVRWMIVGSSLVQLRATVKRSMEAPWHRGAWTFSDDDRLARLTIDGAVLVEADLVGVEDESGADRLRREVHCCWADEPAAAIAEQAGGITRQSWGVAFSSCRLPTHRRVGILTSNAPSRRNWLWKRFVLNPEPGCVAYRIPRGERTTQEYRDSLERSLADSPDQFQRLALGEAALPMKGRPVAQGYRESECVAPRPLHPRHAVLYLGWDAGLTPSCTIVQAVDGRAYVYASLYTERGGTAELIEEQVKPWLVEHAPWALKEPRMMIHAGDPTMATPSQATLADSPLTTLGRLLKGAWRPGPVRWAPRRDALLACFRPGRSRLLISPGEETELLQEALIGGFHYSTTSGGDLRGEEPSKSHPHSDVADSLIYILCELWPAQEREERRARTRQDGDATTRRNTGNFSLSDYSAAYRR